MKISSSLLFLSFWIASCAHSQINSTVLDHNNVSAHISDAGTYFLDFTTQNSGYEVPKGSGKHAIYSTQFWFAAIDTSDDIHFVQGGSPTQGRDVFNGPISDSGTYNTPEYQNKWGNSLWRICQADIDHYKLWWKCANGLITTGCETVGEPSVETLQTIYDWPAHGDISMGQAFYLAPYYDYNSDGLYNPQDGDYPIIKGCCATYMIQNDAAESHSYSNTDSIGIEIHSMFYQYQTWNYLNDVTFVDITAFNRSNTNYAEFIHSIVVDAEIGNYSDDYYGCDSLSNCMYFYNADNNDEDALPYLGYGIDPPAIGIVSLKEAMTSCVPFTNGGLSVLDKWNLMNGLHYNGIPWTDLNSNETQYAYSGNPNNISEWSAMSSGLSTGDARGISSFNYGSFNSGDTLKQSYAITYARDGNNLNNVQSIIDIATDIKSFYDNESNISCNGGTWNVEELNDLFVSISPNPSTGIVKLANPNNALLSLIVSDSQGKILNEFVPSNNSTIEMDLSNQSSGIYFVQIRSEKDTVVKKIVIE